MESKLIAAKSEPLWNTNNKVISIVCGLVILLFALPLFGGNPEDVSHQVNWKAAKKTASTCLLYTSDAADE